MKIIVGLGNHGKKYEHTRHNIGWDVVSMLAEKSGIVFSKKADFKAEVAEVRVDDEKILLVHPITYMNLSGESVAAVQRYYKVGLQDILIIQDEMDFPVGTLVFTAKNGPAGHNGIVSIQESLGTKEIARLRLGIGRPATEQAKESYVLEKFSTAEKKILKELSTRAVKAVEDWVKLGIDKSMNTWNGV